MVRHVVKRVVQLGINSSKHRRHISSKNVPDDRSVKTVYGSNQQSHKCVNKPEKSYEEQMAQREAHKAEMRNSLKKKYEELSQVMDETAKLYARYMLGTTFIVSLGVGYATDRHHARLKAEAEHNMH